jgi:ribosomal protein S18 acetylase RimI-like enzyme
MESTLTLQPMTEDEFSAYKAWVVEDYAREIAENSRISMEEARASSIRDIDGALSQGLATSNQFLYHLVDSAPDPATRLGYLWIEVNSQKQRCFIYDIYLHPQFRHQGWGRKTLDLLEANMRQQGIRRIGLHVFGNNHTAQELYAKMGYEITGLQMQKWL